MVVVAVWTFCGGVRGQNLYVRFSSKCATRTHARVCHVCGVDDVGGGVLVSVCGGMLQSVCATVLYHVPRQVGHDAWSLIQGSMHAVWNAWLRVS